MEKFYLFLLFGFTILTSGTIKAQPVLQMGTQAFVHPTGTFCTPSSIGLGISKIENDKEGVPPRLRVAYVIPSNRTAQPNAVPDMQYLVMLAQSWYREQMKLNGFGEKTFVYESETNSNRPLINIVNATVTDDYIRADPWGRTISAAQNGGLSVFSSNEVWLLIAETHVMRPNGSLVGGIALGAGGAGTSGGVALVGSDWLALFGKLTDNTSFNGQILPALGPYQMVQNVTYPAFPDGTTFSSAASSFIGGTLHEMGHSFGLPHDQRNDINRFGNIMHNGFRGIRGSIYPALYPAEHTRLEFGAALYLNYSHKFNRNQRATTAPSVNISTSSPASLTNGQLALSFTASDSDTLSLAWLVYAGDRVAEMPLSGTSVNTQFVTPYYELAQSREYKVVVVDKQGNVGEVASTLIVQGTGNQAPRPHIFVEEASPNPGQLIAFKATNSSDANDPVSSLSVQWDVNNDGVYDTGWLSVGSALNINYQAAGNYLSKAKVKDQNGAESISAPIATRVNNSSGACRYLMPPLLSGNTIICAGTSTTLTARGCPSTVVWSTGTMSSQLTISPTVSTSYSAYCMLPSGCQSSATSFLVETLSAPTALTVLNVYSSQALITWKHSNNTGPFTVEYKLRTASNWTTIAGLTAPITYINSLASNTAYDWRVTVGCLTSGVSTFTTNAQPTPQYCSVSFTNPCSLGLAIKDVIIGGTYYSQNSSCKPNGYDFSLYPVSTLVSGQMYSFSLLLDGYYNGSQAAIWLDLNGDGQFQNTERLFTTSQQFTAPITGSFQIPIGSPSQNATRLRIILNFNSAPASACGSYGYGEAEDYLIGIAAPCSTVFSVKAGSWNDPSTWSCGHVPVATDPITIHHVVTVPANFTANAQRVTFGSSGRLVYATGAQVRLGL